MLTASLIIAAIGLLVVCVALRRKDGAKEMTRSQVVAAIANALDMDGSGYHDEFDLFVSRPLSDPYLESLRLEILSLCTSEGQPIPGRDFGPLAEAWLQRTHSELTRDGT